MIRLYDTLSRRLRDFEPLVPGQIGMYVCGVTVYDYCHIGHARTFVAFDVIRRWFEARGYRVRFVRNVTDVDDKIIRRAADRGVSIKELTETYTEAMRDDLRRLGCLEPTEEPRATAHIPAMLELIGRLSERGLAYQSEDGDVNFAVRRFPGYGRLSGRSLDELRAGARVEVSRDKRDPLDFVLWKRSQPGQPSWDSPWGPGRPGWHIECSAMSCQYLGESFDIHGGGPDLIFPHHENEIAQSEGAHGPGFARYWLHSGPLRVKNAAGEDEKMSKSLGNFWTIRDAIADTDRQYGADNGSEVLRFFLLRSQYRSPITFHPSLIEDAHRGLRRLYQALADTPAGEAAIDWDDPWCARFAAAMDDDFNTPLATSVLFELAAEVNRGHDSALAAQLRALGATLNILGRDPAVFLRGAAAAVDEEAVLAAIAARAEAKRRRDWATADRIRQELAERGIALTDGPDGTTWRKL